MRWEARGEDRYLAGATSARPRFAPRRGESRGAGWRIVGSGRAAARTRPSVARRMHETPLNVSTELVKG